MPARPGHEPRIAEAVGVRDAVGGDPVTGRAVEFIRAHATEPLAVADVAEQVGYSEFHSARRFAAATGVSPGRYLAAVRFQLAKQLLLAGDMAVVDVCHAVGYSSPGTFTRRFTAEVGVAPAALRRVADRLAGPALPTFHRHPAGRPLLGSPVTDRPPPETETIMTATHAQAGRPIWLDLATHDVEGARAFYGELLGWTFADQGEDFGHYHLVEKDGAPVGGIMSTFMCPEGPTTEPTAPTAWNVYLHDEDVAATVEKVESAGGTLVFGPMDVADQGRQAFVVDPAGAHLGLWQPIRMPGFELSLAPGTPVWFESMSWDFDAALPFYRDLLGWDVSWLAGSPDSAGDGWRYVTNGAGDDAVAGLGDASAFLPPQMPSQWRVYFAVDDADATIERVCRLGGSVHSGPDDSPFGRVAQVIDPQGALFLINQSPGGGGTDDRAPGS